VAIDLIATDFVYTCQAWFGVTMTNSRRELFRALYLDYLFLPEANRFYVSALRPCWSFIVKLSVVLLHYTQQNRK